MDVPTLDLDQQYEQIKDEIDPAIENIIDNTAFILGDAVSDFEDNFADYCGTEHCIGVNSGTAALKLIYDAIGIGPGDEVITSPFTYIATVEPIKQLGAKPVFADIDPETYNLDPKNIEEKITPSTKAIVPVHLYGQPAEIDKFQALADQNDLWLIEDAAQAHGSRWNQQRAGSFGDAAGFSFYPGKNLGAFGDAGGITTSNDSLAKKVRKLRDHGRDDKYSHSMIGYNERMDGLQGAVLDVKLNHLDKWNQGRRDNANFYETELESRPVEPPTVHNKAQHVFHQYVIRTQERDRVLDALQDSNIGAGVHYPMPLHLQKSLSDLGYAPGDLPEAEQASKEVLSLPVFSDLTQEQLNYVVEELSEIVLDLNINKKTA